MSVVTTETETEEQTVETPIKTADDSLTVEERLTDNALHGILPARYFRKDSEGNIIEDADDLFRRVAENVAGAEVSDEDYETWADEFEHQMKTLRFMPNSPTLMNAGTDMNQLSACFVIEPRDDMEDIFETAQQAALIFQSGGGVGYAFSHLRPKGAFINSTGGEASGPVSFMRVFDETCNQVKQGGKRRGAQMGILRADHPDIGRFIVAKRNEGDLANFNISVATTDSFIEAVDAQDSYTLFDPETDYEEPYTVREASAHFYSPEYQDNPRDAFDDGEGAIVAENLWRDYADEIECELFGERVTLREKWEGHEGLRLEVGEPMELPAAFIWDVMIDGAWRNGEPGLFNFEESNRQHSFDVDEYPEFRMNATNPCAEQMLVEYEACNLGHINLSLMLNEDAPTYDEFLSDKLMDIANGDLSTREAVEWYFESAVNFNELDRTIEAGTRFLDNVVTQSDFPIPEITERVNGMRKIGLGIMGFAQMLYQMGVPYGTQDSYEVARCVMRYIDRKGTWASHRLALERGAFSYWDKSKYADPTEYAEWFAARTGLDPEDWAGGFPIRNHNITTIAPTGTTSMIANTTGGCEPAYNVANFKNVSEDIQGDDLLVEFDDYFLRTLKENDLDVESIKEEAETLMRNNEFDGVNDLSIPEDIAEIFVTTQDLSSEQHGLMQRAFQEFCDSGISKTVNLPNEATHDDVSEAYQLALDADRRGAVIKGLTVYRDGSRDVQVLTTRVDNNLDDEGDRDDDLLELYLKGEVSEKAAVQLGIVGEDDVGSDTLTCPECGDGELEKTDDCAVCPECWYSPCK
ncbi:class II ribonucleotide reductase [Halorubrum virus HRTV-26]|nr:class II ribonucleotide reductase [Halorubrum virus HRTV-26]